MGEHDENISLRAHAADHRRRPGRAGARASSIRLYQRGRRLRADQGHHHRRHQVRVRPRRRRHADADGRGADARLVALLAGRESYVARAATRRATTSSSCATGSSRRASTASPGTSRRRRRRCRPTWSRRPPPSTAKRCNALDDLTHGASPLAPAEPTRRGDRRGAPTRSQAECLRAERAGLLARQGQLDEARAVDRRRCSAQLRLAAARVRARLARRWPRACIGYYSAPQPPARRQDRAAPTRWPAAAARVTRLHALAAAWLAHMDYRRPRHRRAWRATLREALRQRRARAPCGARARAAWWWRYAYHFGGRLRRAPSPGTQAAPSTPSPRATRPCCRR